MNILEKIIKKYPEKVKKAAFARWYDPMLAKLTYDYFDDPDWIYERKFDGQRCIAYKKGNNVRLMSRNEKEANAYYPELVVAMQQIGPKNVVVDGEIVAFEKNVTSFAKLQQRMHLEAPDQAAATGVKVYYYIFDILYIDQYDVRKLPLKERKRLIRAYVHFSDPIRLTVHRKGTGKAYRKEACKKDWEGVIAKNLEAPYQGKRSSDWLKFKCFNEQELVIGGYTAPQGSRIGFGALLLGYYAQGKLHYAGKVGTGWSDQMLEDLHAKLDKIETKKCPFTDYDGKEKQVTWVKPKLVAQIRFENWTQDYKLRHSSYLGLRIDKKAKDVVLEDIAELLR